MKVCCYITGHGYGHATRAIHVLRALRARVPGLRILVRSLAPHNLFVTDLGPAWTFEPVALDVGVVERSLFAIDVAATLQAWESFLQPESLDRLLQSEAEFLRREAVDLVFFDVPPPAAEVAARAGIPSVAMSNFSWEFILRAYCEEAPGFRKVVERLEAFSAQTTLALQLPLGPPMVEFPRRVDIPLVAPPADATREVVRAEFGLRDDDVALLIALRGNAIPPLGALPPRCRVVSFESRPEHGSILLPPAWQARFSTVLAACDVVLAKPGYGIASEVVAQRRPVLSLHREDFAETPHLLRELRALVPLRELSLQDVQGPRLAELIEAVRQQPFPSPPRLDGATVAADHILRVAGQR